MKEALVYIGETGMIGGLFLQIYFWAVHNPAYFYAAFISTMTSFIIFRIGIRAEKPFYSFNNYKIIKDEKEE